MNRKANALAIVLVMVGFVLTGLGITNPMQSSKTAAQEQVVDVPPFVDGKFTYDLYFRWTLVTWFGTNEIPVQDALSAQGLAAGGSDVSDIVTAVYGWSQENGFQAYFPGGPTEASNLHVLFTDEAYWIAVDGESKWTIRQPAIGGLEPPTGTEEESGTPAETETPDPEATATDTPEPGSTNTSTPTETSTPSPTPTTTNTVGPGTPTNTQLPPTATPTNTRTPTASPTPTRTPSPTATRTPSPTNTPVTPSPTATNTPNATGPVLGSFSANQGGTVKERETRYYTLSGLRFTPSTQVQVRNSLTGGSFTTVPQSQVAYLNPNSMELTHMFPDAGTWEIRVTNANGTSEVRNFTVNPSTCVPGAEITVPLGAAQTDNAPPVIASFYASASVPCPEQQVVIRVTIDETTPATGVGVQFAINGCQDAFGLSRINNTNEYEIAATYHGLEPSNNFGYRPAAQSPDGNISYAKISTRGPGGPFQGCE